ncbi:hypothetical protein UCRPA7_3985 [Phaeoacremonium minimum UCRPA7]|uniref:Uncharacterized protein n=1 Tax=Phaeoacremonium minimum (strain UCR-PA7) TaxID=1286976 RepID=R8BMA9_PHAM7|nr:hypothetical protein UCRPA7_3985 [Phaeoacremonium minimum UCRPA7]EOO00518.1 hypothetical protein UCRPA7_3985 [Phaeoacremonium minimum UCRPA7]
MGVKKQHGRPAKRAASTRTALASPKLDIDDDSTQATASSQVTGDQHPSDDALNGVIVDNDSPSTMAPIAEGNVIAPKKFTTAAGVSISVESGSCAPKFTLSANINPSLLPILGNRPRGSFDRNTEVFANFVAPNPWKFLELYKRPYYEINDASPSHSHSSEFSQDVFQLMQLPRELLCCIAKVLPPESAAAFAIVNKVLYGTLGPRVLQLRGYNLWRLLVLLERDMVFFIACPNCLKLHSPAIKYTDDDPASCEVSAVELALPHKVKHSTVRAVAKAYLQNRNYGEFLTYVNYSLKNFEEHRQSIQTVSSRMIRGNLLLQNQIIIRPRKANTETMRSMWELDQFLGSFWNGRSICQHKSWKQSRPKLCVEDMNKLADQHDSAHHVQTEWHKLHHVGKCFSDKDIRATLNKEDLTSAVSGGLLAALFNKKLSSVFGRVKGCTECFTDYTVTPVDIEGAGRCLVLTVWKDLGGIGPGQDTKWETHLEMSGHEERLHANIRMGGDAVRAADIGEIYCAWEALNAAKFDPKTHTYEPNLPSRIIDQFQKKAKQLVAAQEEDDAQYETDGDSSIDESM